MSEKCSSSKRLGLLHELVPTATTFGILVDPTNPNTEFETADMQGAVDRFGYKYSGSFAAPAHDRLWHNPEIP